MTTQAAIERPASSPAAFFAYSDSLDRDRPSEMVHASDLSNQDRFSHLLQYRYTDNGECVTVPNVWYNQPVQWRISALNREIGIMENDLSRLEAQGVCESEPGCSRFVKAEEHRQLAMAAVRQRMVVLAGVIATMERTGTVTH